MSKILVTGGAGFIGSNFVRMMLNGSNHAIVNLDALTYAGNLENLADVASNPRYTFVKGDIADSAQMDEVFATHRPDVVVHFAAESHVDRSVLDATAFVRTNVQGTQVLLDKSRHYKVGRFVHVSTDEVYGSLGAWGFFTEDTPMQANSPYSASKAASDLLVRAAVHTHGMDCVVTRCSNNYGPYQFPEKLIPLMVANALEGKNLPVYGDGKNVRDWLYVEDHASAIWAIVTRGRLGETYNVGGENEWTNIDLVKFLCTRLAEVQGKNPQDYLKLITYVKDRPGHDHRYAIDCEKLKGELKWKQSVTFEQGLEATIRWYLDNQAWVAQVTSGEYLKWVQTNYQAR